ncbi:MAG TPA: hypothetical protein VER76_08305, partial [Pyrinomonadaceae bacterium]|nr:hypothetical protein [Pyrinomonadaceae bacterium]
SMPVLFLYFLFRTPSFQSHIYSHTSGTTVLHLSRNGLPDYTFVCPSDEVLVSFQRLVAPMFASIEANEQQSIKLADIRDALLPKLISGQLRIPDVAESEGSRL